MANDNLSLSERTAQAAENALAERKAPKLSRRAGRRESKGIRGGMKGLERAVSQTKELEELDPTKKWVAPASTATPGSASMAKEWDKRSSELSIADLNEETDKQWERDKEKMGMSDDRSDLVNDLIALNAKRGTMSDEDLRAQQLAILGGTDKYGTPLRDGEPIQKGEKVQEGELSRVDQYKAAVAKAREGAEGDTPPPAGDGAAVNPELFDVAPSVGEDGSETWKVKGDPYTYKKDPECNITVVSGPTLDGKSETGRKIVPGSTAHRAIMAQLKTTRGGSEWSPTGGKAPTDDTDDTADTADTAAPADTPPEEGAEGVEEGVPAPYVSETGEVGPPLPGDIPEEAVAGEAQITGYDDIGGPYGITSTGDRVLGDPSLPYEERAQRKQELTALRSAVAILEDVKKREAEARAKAKGFRYHPTHRFTPVTLEERRARALVKAAQAVKQDQRKTEESVTQARQSRQAREQEAQRVRARRALTPYEYTEDDLQALLDS